MKVWHTAKEAAAFTLYFIVAAVVVILLAFYMTISSIFHFVKGSDKNVNPHRSMGYWR